MQDDTGKDLLLLDPTDQAYEFIYADSKTSTIVKFERDSLP